MIQSPTFLDHLAMYLLEDKNGRPRGFVLQTMVDLIGIPTVLSIGDMLGVLRGYLSLREGFEIKGWLEIITAILPFIPTGPVHYVIEKMFNSPTRVSEKPVPAQVVK